MEGRIGTSRFRVTKSSNPNGRSCRRRLTRPGRGLRSHQSGGLACLESLRPSFAFSASGSDPTPIPGGLLVPSFTPVPADPDIHVLPPAPSFDVSTITDFSGFVAAAEIQGNATGGGSSFTFDADMRVMQGKYVGQDGRVRDGSFGFI